MRQASLWVHRRPVRSAAQRSGERMESAWGSGRRLSLNVPRRTRIPSPRTRRDGPGGTAGLAWSGRGASGALKTADPSVA